MFKGRTGIKKAVILSIRCLTVLIIGMLFAFSVTAQAQEKAETARPSVNGPLRVSGRFLTDQDGQAWTLLATGRRQPFSVC